MSTKRTRTPRTTRRTADTNADRWRRMKVICVNRPDPARAAHVMQLVVNSNLSQPESQPANQVPSIQS